MSAKIFLKQLLFLVGIGTVITLMTGWAVFLHNFGTRYGGRMAVAVAIGFACSTSVVSTSFLTDPNA